MKEKNYFKNVAIFGISLWLFVFAMLPFLLVVVASVMTRSQVHFLTPVFSLEAYRSVLSPGFLRIFLDSVGLAVITSAICLLAGYPFAYFLARIKSKRKHLLLLLVIIPFWTNSLIRTYALIFILKSRGLLNSMLLSLNIVDKPIAILYTDAAVLAGLIYTLLPFMILPLYVSIEKLDPNLLEAARDMGAGKFRAFWHVSLPLTMPGIIAGTMLVFLPALGMFFIPDILGGAKSLLIGNFIKNQFLTARDWPAGSAASVLVTGLMILLLRVYYRSSLGKGKEEISL